MPDEDLELAGPSRWMEGQQLLVSREALTKEAPILHLVFRNRVSNQKLTLSVGETIVREDVSIPEDDMSVPLRCSPIWQSCWDR
jgi:hypothetical protein